MDLTIDAITADKVNSITLYTSSDNNTWVEASSFGKATGVQTATLATPATGLYYKIELDCASGSANGLVTVSKVEYYYNSDGPSTPTITASNIELAYDATEGAIAYTITTGSRPKRTLCERVQTISSFSGVKMNNVVLS